MNNSLTSRVLSTEELQTLVERIHKGEPSCDVSRQMDISHTEALRLYRTHKSDVISQYTMPPPKVTGEFPRYRPVFGR